MQSKVAETNKALPLAVPSPPTLRGRGWPGRAGGVDARCQGFNVTGATRRVERLPLLTLLGHPLPPRGQGNGKRQCFVRKGFPPLWIVPGNKAGWCERGACSYKREAGLYKRGAGSATLAPALRGVKRRLEGHIASHRQRYRTRGAHGICVPRRVRVWSFLSVPCLPLPLILEDKVKYGFHC
jgi:hypothetical protein